MLQGLGEQGIPLPLLGDEGGAVACQQLQQRRAAELARVRVRATVGPRARDRDRDRLTLTVTLKSITG